MPWTRDKCASVAPVIGELSNPTTRERANYCLRCDHLVPIVADMTCAGAVTAYSSDVIPAIFLEDDQFLQNYKRLFQGETLFTEYNRYVSPVEPTEVNPGTVVEILSRTIGSDELEDLSQEDYEARRTKCNSLKCGEDCKNDDDCYWNIPFDLEVSGSKCSCKPNIFLNTESVFSKESLQERLADEFYNIYSEELQINCDITESVGNYNRGEIMRATIGGGEISRFCSDLTNTARISEAIYSSPSDSNVKNLFETCLDKEEYRENILKHCLSKPLVICDDENDDNPDCIQMDFSYYGIISDIFGYYFLRNTSYENPDRCECNLLEIDEEGPPYYSLDDTKYIRREKCEDSRYGIPRGICGYNMPVVQSYLDANESLITDESSANDLMTGILNKNKCERKNSIKYNDTDYFHSRLYCDPSNDNIFNLDDDMDQMIENKYYETISEYNIRSDFSQSISDNNLRKWNSASQEYTTVGDDQIDYNILECTSNIHKCMGFEPVVADDSKYSDLYETALDSHYYLLPLDITHTSRDLGYIRCFAALNNHYLGNLTFNFPYGKLYGYMIETLHNITSDTTSDTATALDEQYEVVQTVKQGGRVSTIVNDEQAADEMGSIDRIELEETLLTVYELDYLNTIRDYTILAILFICSIIFLYFYSFIILFAHIPWIISYISYIKIKEYI